MHRLTIVLGMSAALALLPAVTGCGLLEDATTFTVDTGWKQVAVNSADLGITIPGNTIVPQIPCEKSNDLCAQSTDKVSCKGTTYACRVQCGDQKSCEIVADITESIQINLADQIKNQSSATVLSKVSFTRMIYNTEQNTLTFDTPKIELFIGPQAANGVTDQGVVRLASMPMIPKGQTPNGEVTDVTAAGKESLSSFVKNYQVPFKLFAKATTLFSGGDALPQGQIALKLKAFFQITL